MQHLLKSHGVQAKLAVGEPDDPLERDADLAAARAEGGQFSHARAPCACGTTGEGECDECRSRNAVVQRKPAAPDGPAAPDVPAAPLAGTSLQPHGSGTPLDRDTRRFMEARLGAGFADVRVFHDSRAADAARSINALAYATGSNIVFGAGQYAPHTSAGRKLLAHELTHTIQQRSNGVPAVQRQTARETGELQSSQAAEPDGQAGSPIAAVPSSGGTFEGLQTSEPYVALLVEHLSSNYRALIREIDPVLSRAGVYERRDLNNELQRAARQRVFAYENEIVTVGLYDAVHLSLWLERMTAALEYLGPLLGALGAIEARAARAEQADATRRDLLSAARELASSPFISRGVAERERQERAARAAERIAAAVEYIRGYLLRIWRPDLDERAGRLHGVAIANQLVHRMHLSAAEVREVLDTLRDEDPRLLEAALLRGGTVQALLAMGIGDLQAYRAAGEGFFAGAIRAERESLIARPPGARVFSFTERLIAVGGFIAGAFQGVGDSIISNIKGIVALFTPSFWRGMVDFFTNFLPRFIDNEDFRFQLGQMMGHFSADEERRLASVDPFEYGRTFGNVFGMALTEIVLTFVGLGFILKAVNGSARLQRIARPLVAIAEAVGRTAVAARGLRAIQAIGEGINALSRRIRRLMMLLPDLTPNARLRRTLFELEEAERGLQAAADRAQEIERLARQALAAGDEEAAQRHAQDLAEAADDLERQLGAGTPTREPEAPGAGAADTSTEDAFQSRVERWIDEELAGADLSTGGAAPVGAAGPTVPARTASSFRQALDAVDLSGMSAAERARLQRGWAIYSQRPNRRLPTEDDYIRFVYGKRSGQLPRTVTLGGGGLGVEAEVGIEAGRTAERVQGVLRNTVKNNVAYEVTFSDPLRQITVTKTVIPDFMPTTRTDSARRFLSARSAGEAVLIADSKYTWDAAKRVVLDDQIRAMLILARRNNKPFVFLLREGGDVSSGVRNFANAIGAEIHLVRDVSGLIR